MAPVVHRSTGIGDSAGRPTGCRAVPAQVAIGCHGGDVDGRRARARQVLKPLFGRESDGALAYPSGHTTTMVVVMGVLVLVAGAPLGSVFVAVTHCVLGMIGQSVSYHFFTDTVGALLLG